MVARIKLNSLADLGAALATKEPEPAADFMPSASPLALVGHPIELIPVPPAQVYSHVIKEFMQEADATISDMARALWSISPNHSIWRARKALISRWLSGKEVPSLQDRELLASLFNTPGWKLPKPVPTKKEKPVVVEPVHAVESAADDATHIPVNPPEAVTTVGILRLQVRGAGVEIFHNPEEEVRQFNMILTSIPLSTLTWILQGLQSGHMD